MNDNREEVMAFREWTEHYEKEQESQRSQISELTKIVHSLSADVKTLVENQRGMFSRINRPFNWGWFATGVGIIFVGIGLVINPIKSTLRHIEEIGFITESRLNSVEKEIAVAMEAKRWNEKMTDRNNHQIDEIWFQLKEVSEACTRLHGCKE